MTTTTYDQYVRWRECGRKVRHDSQYAANLAVLTIWAGGGYARAYGCPRCGGYHVTSRRKVAA